MNLTKEEKTELEELSKTVFGSKHRWRKMVENGYKELVTRRVTEQVPGENGREPTIREDFVPVLTNSGGKQFVTKYYTVESIKQFMIERKAQIDTFMESIKKQQKEKKAKEEQAKLSQDIHEKASGSAL